MPLATLLPNPRRHGVARPPMIIREYRSTDCAETAELFYTTVHAINAADYTREQLAAWAPEQRDLESWNRSLLEHYSLVAEENHAIAGFGDISSQGCLDRLYVHKDFQRQGVATAICNALEQRIRGNIVTHASITARPFFEKRGYTVVREQQVKRQGLVLVNFVMEKHAENRVFLPAKQTSWIAERGMPCRFGGQ